MKNDKDNFVMMIQSKIRWFTVVIILVMSVLPVNAQTLEQYLAIAEENNPALKASYAEYEAAMQRIVQAKSLQDPTISASAFGRMVETRTGTQMAQFSIEQMFPWFGALKARGDAAALEAEAQYQLYRDTRNELHYNVKRAYYPLYELDNMIALQRENQEILDVYKSLATSAFGQGQSPMTDVLRTNIMIDELAAEVQLLELKRQPLVAAFNALLGRGRDHDVQVADTLLFPALDKISAGSINPKVQSLEKMTEAAKVQQKVARKEGLPMIGVGFNYIVIEPSMDAHEVQSGRDAYMPMLTLSLPIYRKKYKAMEKEAAYMKASYQEMRNDMINEIESMTVMAGYELQRAQTLYQLYDRQTVQIQQTLDLLTTGLGSATSSLQEVLEMNQELLRYKTEKVKVLTEALMAEALLTYLNGSNTHDK